MSPALAGGFLSTVPPGKSKNLYFNKYSDDTNGSGTTLRTIGLWCLLLNKFPIEQIFNFDVFKVIFLHFMDELKAVK